MHKTSYKKCPGFKIISGGDSKRNNLKMIDDVIHLSNNNRKKKLANKAILMTETSLLEDSRVVEGDRYEISEVTNKCKTDCTIF